MMDYHVGVVASRAGHLASQLPSLCKEARGSTYATKSLLEATRSGVAEVKVERREESVWVRGEDDWEGRMRCGVVTTMQPCLCSVEQCSLWFPCSLKYCRNSGGEGEHRCGIRTCSKCTTLR